MRIVTVLTSLGVGGAEKQALAVAERMAERGHEVALAVLRPRLAEEWPTSLRRVHLEIRGVRKHPASLVDGISGAGGGFCGSSGRMWSTATAFTPIFWRACSGSGLRARW